MILSLQAHREMARSNILKDCFKDLNTKERSIVFFKKKKESPDGYSSINSLMQC